MIVIDALIILIVVFVLFLFFYKFYFLRNPSRQIPFGDNIISPADGLITSIKKFNKNKVNINKRFLGKAKSFTKDVSDSGYMVSIFMNVFDVHFNRAPMSGIVKYIVHSKGKFLNALKPESTFENENVQILFQSKNFKLKTIQIAGLVARRIVPFIKKNDKIIKGQRIGLIKLGSQVTIILSDKVKLKVVKGQRVLAGETIIAEK
ncbi:phosphatidylserine decarboxylase family protein [Candidatus Woesearchaeota archaeon]|jgi:phosphatidylserine decarboxylase|nr:phosphatidylserine decarboxylase family protein [Candidatus Woesearchaeota archaeon]|tara:strand:- start:3510 stop:4124 length:615 start_codon:yes stop_codon:yes gene_type:complete